MIWHVSEKLEPGVVRARRFVQIPPRSLTVVEVQVEKECLLGIVRVENEL